MRDNPPSAKHINQSYGKMPKIVLPNENQIGKNIPSFW